MTSHIFSEDGSLKTWAESPGPTPRLPSPIDSSESTIMRLLEVLLGQKVIDRDEALYVVTGVVPEGHKDKR